MNAATVPALRQLVFTAKDVRTAFEATLERAGGSLGVWIVLNAVSDEGFISHRILATRAHVDGATITHHVDRAEALGLVRRQVDPDDRRVRRLELTPAGTKLHRGLLAIALDFERAVFSGIPEDAQRQLRETLASIKANIEARTAAVVP